MGPTPGSDDSPGSGSGGSVRICGAMRRTPITMRYSSEPNPTQKTNKPSPTVSCDARSVTQKYASTAAITAPAPIAASRPHP